MTDARFQQYLARFQNARLNRRALVQGAAAAAVAIPAGAGLALDRVSAAPLAAPRRQIDATTLVIADDLTTWQPVDHLRSGLDLRDQLGCWSVPRL